MRNDELFSPNCPDDHAKKLAKFYVMRGLTDERGTYFADTLLARQNAVYEEWLAAVRGSTTSFDCGFYEWLGRSCDAAFALRPGDLVKYSGVYCVVARRRTREVTWVISWRLRNGMPVQEPWPQPMREVELKDPDGKVFIVDVLNGPVEPADIPPEVFALACEKAKGCPMMKGGRDGK